MGWDAGVEKVHKFPKSFMHQWQGSRMIVDGPVIQNVCLVMQMCKVLGCPPHF